MVDVDESSGQRADADARQTVVRLLPEFRLVRRGRTLAPAPRAQRLIALLALNDRPLSRSQVAGTLWPDSTEARALSCLRTTLLQLRHVHGTLVAGAGRGLICLASEVEVDWAQAVAAAELTILGTGDAPEGDLLELLRYPLLESWSEEWLDSEQEAFAELRAHALEQLSRDLARRGRFAHAVQVAMIAVAAHPLRESAYEVLIRAHLARGNRAEALRTFRRLEQALLTEVGLRPNLALSAIAGAR